MISPEEFLYLIILSLINWRVCNMVIEDNGILDIFVRFRFAIGVNYINEERVYSDYKIYKENIIKNNLEELFWAYPTNHISKLFSCIYCLSVWGGFFVTTLFHQTNNNFLLNYFAVISITILIEELTNNV